MAFLAENPVQTHLITSAAGFSTHWRRWMSQWSQPQLLRLSEAYLGARLFHSSQMSGFATGKLQNPAPKAFVAIGLLNVAHARSLGYPASQIDTTPDLGLPSTLPGSLRQLWEPREPLLDASGVAMGPTGLFEAFCGLRALPSPPDRHIPPEAAESVSKALGSRLRLYLGQKGVDWLTDLPQLSLVAPSVEPLLKGETTTAAHLLNDLPRLAKLLDTSDDALWRDLATQVGLDPAP